MSDSSLSSTPHIAATPAGQRVQSFGNRAWRAFGMTAWWRLVLGSAIVIVAVALIAIPFDLFRMAQRIQSQAAKDALRSSLQLEALERARGGLIVARSLADESSVGEIDTAISEIERELAKPIARTRFEGSFAELQQKIEAQTEKRNKATKRLNETAIKLAQAQEDARGELTDKIREITEEIEAAQETLSALEEQKAEMLAARATEQGERAALEARRAELEARRASRGTNAPKATPSPPQPPAPPTAPAVRGEAPQPSNNGSMTITTTTNADGSVTKVKESNSSHSKVDISLFGNKIAVFDDAQPSATIPSSLGFLPGEPSAEQIRATVNRDVKKFIIAGIATLALIALFFLMLIARSFAGRAVRGEQRAVIAESRERTESHARQLAEARLTLMRAQVEPHFLFNTLAHVQALQEIDPPQAGTMLERLISYLRAAMPSMRETKSTLGREVEVVRAYLDLLKIRMGDRLRYSIDLPADLQSVSLPPTMIATLVENAIKHGLEPKKEGGSIAVNVRKLSANEAHPERVEILVADDGLGFGAADTGGTGIGLANTRERLKMLYGPQAELAVEPNAPSGVRAIIRVPMMVPETVDDVHDEPLTTAGDASIAPFAIQTVVLLAVCFGWLGVHRFYVGKIRTGALQAGLGLLSIISSGLPIFLVPLVIWIVLDVVWIATREFRDVSNRRIVHLRHADVGHEPAASPGVSSANVSTYTIQVMALLALFLGWLGMHRFYVGRYRTGALQAGLFLLSIVSGGLPIFLLPLIMWVVLDLAWILSRDFRDSQGRRIMRRDSDDMRRYSATQAVSRRVDASVSQSSRGIALLLAVPLGVFGAHRFYVGRVGTALAMLVTLGGLGIWWLVDIVIVATGQLKDMDGKWVSEWE